MVDKNKNQVSDDPIKRLESELQFFVEETNRRFEQMDERQQSFESKMVDFAALSKRVEEILLQISSGRQQSLTIMAQPQLAVSQTGTIM